MSVKEEVKKVVDAVENEVKHVVKEVEEFFDGDDVQDRCNAKAAAQAQATEPASPEASAQMPVPDAPVPPMATPVTPPDTAPVVEPPAAPTDTQQAEVPSGQEDQSGAAAQPANNGLPPAGAEAQAEGNDNTAPLDVTVDAAPQEAAPASPVPDVQ